MAPDPVTVPVESAGAVPAEGHIAGGEAGDRLAEDDGEVDGARVGGIGLAATAWLMVTVGATLSKATELSVEVEAALLLPAASVTLEAAMRGDHRARSRSCRRRPRYRWGRSR